jgi:hypothetical protein
MTLYVSVKPACWSDVMNELFAVVPSTVS